MLNIVSGTLLKVIEPLNWSTREVMIASSDSMSPRGIIFPASKRKKSLINSNSIFWLDAVKFSIIFCKRIFK